MIPFDLLEDVYYDRKERQMKKGKGFKQLIPEPMPLHKERKGGGMNLLLVALLLEAARMVDDKMDRPSIEAAAKKAFGISKGFLSLMDEIGIPDVIAALEALSSDSDPEDPIHKIYHNFFTPATSCKRMLKSYEEAEDKEKVRWISEEDARKEAADFMLVDSLKKRFQAVAFQIVTELVESEILELQDVDRLCKKTFGWEEGPFSMMNSLGIQEAMQIVTEKMQLSHRKEINFPIPWLLISQAKKNEPWPLNSKLT
jgi:enoyl-CoA hydratase/3-hydroxyacyl-CoA dehydrogenase